MRILHVIDDLGSGGAERNMVSVLPKLERHEQRVLALSALTPYAHALEDAGISVSRRPLTNVTAIYEAIRFLRREVAWSDVVHTQRWVSDFLGRFLAAGRKPIVTTIQTSPYDPVSYETFSLKGKALTRTVQLADIVLSQSAARIVATSDCVRKLAIERLHVDPDKVKRVYNAVDSRQFSFKTRATRARARALLGVPADAKVFGVSGKVVPTKGQHLLIEALPGIVAEVPNCVLCVIGDGESVPALQARIAKLGMRAHVRWMGLRDDVADLLPGLDVCALPSVFEGLPLSIVEAMMTGVPCVLSSIPPHRELTMLVGSEAYPWMIVSEPNPEQWAVKLVALLRNGAQCDYLGRASADCARTNFDATVAAAQLDQIFREAVASS